MVEVLVRQVLYVLIGGLVGSIIPGAALKAVVRWVGKPNVTFWKAYWAIYLSALASGFVGIVASMTVLIADGGIEGMRLCQIILSPFGFFIQAWIVGSQLRFSYGMACIVCLITLGLTLGIALGLGLVAGLLIVLATLMTGPG